MNEAGGESGITADTTQEQQSEAESDDLSWDDLGDSRILQAELLGPLTTWAYQ
jgi:hypothetical protein